jgi:hypothetical protein
MCGCADKAELAGESEAPAPHFQSLVYSKVGQALPPANHFLRGLLSFF